MFVATDWYHTSQQNGGVLGSAPGDLLTVFPALGIAFFGISVPLLLQGSEKYKTRVKIATALLISMSVVSATVGHWLDALHTELHLWPGPPPVSPKEALNMMSYTVNSPTNVTLKIINGGPTNVSLVAYFVKNPNGQWYNNSRWWGPTFSPDTIATINFSDRWEHVHIPIRLLVHCLRGNIKEQSDWVSNQSLALA